MEFIKVLLILSVIGFVSSVGGMIYGGISGNSQYILEGIGGLIGCLGIWGYYIGSLGKK